MKAKPLSALLAAAVASFAMAGNLHAADLYWDGADTTADADGGAGTWDTSTLNWDDAATGGNNATWNNGTPDNAFFGGVAGTVTLSGGITVNALQFDVTGYTLTGSTLTLGATTPTITVATGASAIINSALAGTAGITKAGAGTLTINTGVTLGYTGATTVSSGILIVNTTGNYIQAINTASAITVGAGAEIRFTGGANGMQRTAAQGAVTLNGGTFDYRCQTHGHMGNITLNDGAVWKATSGGGYDGENMQLNGDVTVGGSSASTIGTFNQGLGLVGIRTFNVGNVTGDANVDLTVSAELENNDSGPGDGIDKTGAGTMNITASATYTGATTVTGGVLRISAGMTGTSGITVQSGATLETNAINIFVTNHSTALAASRVITLNNGTWVMTGSHDARIGNVTLNNGSTWTSNRGLSGYDVLLANVSTGAATVAVTGTGASTMNGSGGIHLQGVQNFDVADTTGDAAADLVVSLTLGAQGLSGGAAGGVNKQGGGTMAIGTQTQYTGGTTVAAGVLDLTGGGGSGGTIRGTVTVNSGATLRLSTGDATGYGTGADRLSTINLDGGTLHVNTTSNQTLGNAVINMTGASITGITGSNLDFFNGSSALNSLASATTSTIAGTKLSIRQTGGLTITTADGTAAKDLTISSVIASNGGYAAEPLVKAGDGTLELTGANTYTGATQVNVGTLVVNNTTGSGTGTGTVTVASGATLAGNGTLAGNTTINGTHNPGNSPGIQSFGGDLGYGATAIFNWELTDNTTTQGTSPNYTYDQVAVTGALTITSGATFNLVFNGTGSGVDFSDAFWTSDRSWTVFTGATSVTGNFTLGSITNDSVGNPYTASNPYGYFTVNGATLTWTAVPEPGSALAGLLLGAGLLRRRRQRL